MHAYWFSEITAYIISAACAYSMEVHAIRYAHHMFVSPYFCAQSDVTAREQMHNTLAEMNDAQLTILAQVPECPTGGWLAVPVLCCEPTSRFTVCNNCSSINIYCS